MTPDHSTLNAQLSTDLRTLGTDPRFTSILILIQQHKADFVLAGCDQRLAADGNKQSHAWGSVYALQTLEERLLTIVNTPPPEVKRRRKAAAEPDGS